MKLSVNATVLLAGRHDFLGSPTAPYTLVEFGDYQCPPCRRSQNSVDEVLNNHKDSLKVDFRNLPLSDLHPHAEAAALCAETSRIQGDESFWALHKKLFDIDLDGDEAKELLKKHTNKRAAMQVGDDTALAAKLGIESTPTFLLCQPNGQVLHLSNLQDVNNFVR